MYSCTNDQTLQEGVQLYNFQGTSVGCTAVKFRFLLYLSCFAHLFNVITQNGVYTCTNGNTQQEGVQLYILKGWQWGVQLYNLDFCYIWLALPICSMLLRRKWCAAVQMAKSTNRVYNCTFSRDASGVYSCTIQIFAISGLLCPFVQCYSSESGVQLYKWPSPARGCTTVHFPGMPVGCTTVQFRFLLCLACFAYMFSVIVQKVVYICTNGQTLQEGVQRYIF